MRTSPCPSPGSRNSSPRTTYTPMSPNSKAKLQSMISRVHTAVRLRPPSAAEKENDKVEIVFINTLENCIDVLPTSGPTKLSSKKYKFDDMFDINASQKDVYAKIGRPLVQCAMQGINCSLFAYGQTGTGKIVSLVYSLFLHNDSF